MTQRILLLGTLSVLLMGSSASAGDELNAEGLMCHERPALQDRYAYLRSLSFHLRGHAPSVAEYEALDTQDDVSEAQIDAYLAAPAFSQRVARLHRKLL